MARITLGVIATNVSGKMGGLVYAFNRYGAYIRQKSSVVNPLSGLQTAARDKFIAGSNVWSSLTAEQRADWQQYAAAVQVRTAKGYVTYLAANAMCTRINAARIAAGLAPVTAPPANLVLPTIDTALAGALDASDQTLSVTYTPGAANMLLTTSKIQVYMAAPRSASRAFNNGTFRYVGAIDGVTPAGTSPKEFATIPYVVAAGDVCRVKFRTITLLEGVSEFHGEQDVVVGA